MRIIKNKRAEEGAGFTFTQIVILVVIIALIVIMFSLYFTWSEVGAEIIQEYF